MGFRAGIVRAIVDGRAPSPTYAAVGALEAVADAPGVFIALVADPLGALSSVRGFSVRETYDALVARGHVRVVSDGAEAAVRYKIPDQAQRLVGPARTAATRYAKGRQRYNSATRR